MKRYVSYLLVILFLVMLILIHPAVGSVDQPQKLDTIDSLSYEVTGVERAIRITGEKIAIKLRPEVVLPALCGLDRPSISSTSIWIPPSHPENISKSGKGYYRCHLNGGGFKNYGLNLLLLSQMGKVGIRGEGWFDHPARLIRAGVVNHGGIRLNGNISVWNGTAVAPGIYYNRNTFRLNKVENSMLTWDDICFDLSFSEIATPIGTINASGRYESRQYSDAWEMNVKNSEYRFAVVKTTGSGVFRFNTDYTEELFKTDGDNIDLLEMKALYEWWMTHRLKIGIGLQGYLGSNPITDRTEFIPPLVKLGWAPQFGGIFEITWNPEVVHISRNDLSDRLPMISEASRGSLVEDMVHLQSSYVCPVSEIIDFSIKADYQEARHVPVLSCDVSLVDSQPWEFGYYRMRNTSVSARAEAAISSKIGLDCFVEYHTAEIINEQSTNEVPETAPLKTGLSGSINVYKLIVKNTFTWTAAAPLTFDGSLERPEYLAWNINLTYPFSHRWSAGLEFRNLLNRRAWVIPGYDNPPFHFQLNIHYRGRL